MNFLFLPIRKQDPNQAPDVDGGKLWLKIFWQTDQTVPPLKPRPQKCLDSAGGLLKGTTSEEQSSIKQGWKTTQASC